MLVDSHCHIHESDYPLPAEEVLKRAKNNGVGKIICIGTSVENSKKAIKFAISHDNVYATVGIHPHHAKKGIGNLEDLLKKRNPKVVAVGEIGLDYHYKNSSKSDQIQLLRQQIELALKYNLPIVFHVREAFDDFWKVFDSYQGIRGELHCFSDSRENAEKAISRGLFIGINGLSTFTKDKIQQEVFATIPLDKMILETDAPYLTPEPFRGKINEPAFVRNVAVYGGISRHISEEEIANATTQNVQALFNLDNN